MDSLLETYCASRRKDGTMGPSQSQKAGQRGVASHISVLWGQTLLCGPMSSFFLQDELRHFLLASGGLKSRSGHSSSNHSDGTTRTRREWQFRWGRVTLDFSWSSPAILVTLVSCLLTFQRCPFSWVSYLWFCKLHSAVDTPKPCLLWPPCFSDSTQLSSLISRWPPFLESLLDIDFPALLTLGPWSLWSPVSREQFPMPLCVISHLLLPEGRKIWPAVTTHIHPSFTQPGDCQNQAGFGKE